MEFHGDTFIASRDGLRLSKQYDRVRELVIDGQFRTLAEIAAQVQAPEASVSARLRDLRRAGYQVDRRYVRRGLHAYAVRIVASGQGELFA